MTLLRNICPHCDNLMKGGVIYYRNTPIDIIFCTGCHCFWDRRGQTMLKVGKRCYPGILADREKQELKKLG